VRLGVVPSSAATFTRSFAPAAPLRSEGVMYLRHDTVTGVWIGPSMLCSQTGSEIAKVSL
jgi:hypothetical protein